MKCLLCNSLKIEYKFTYSGGDIYLKKLNVLNFDLKWYRCINCQVFFSRQYENIEKIYDDVSVYDANYDEKAIQERYEKIINLPEASSDNYARVVRCKGYHTSFVNMIGSKKTKYNVLDVGAGMGVFIKKFQDTDYELEALELNKVAVKHLKKVLQVNVHQEYMEELKFEDKFDLITLNRVLEHIERPIDVMNSVSKALKLNGLVYLELPDSLSFEIDGETNEAFSSGHYMVYNSASICYLFDKSGLELLKLSRVREPSGKYTIYAFGRKIK